MSIKFKRLVFAFQLILAYIRKHFLFFTAGLFLGLILFIIGPTIAGRFNSNRSTVIGLVGNYTITTLPPSIQKMMSFGLTKLTADGQATAGAALDFSATDSGKTFVFNLDPSLKWQDGKPLRSSNINYNLRGVGVEKNQQSISFHLSDPYAPLPVVLSQPLFKNGIISKFSFLPDFLNRIFYQNALVGLGEYQLNKMSFNGRFLSTLELKRVADGSLIDYRFYPSVQIAKTALKLGLISELDGVFDPSGFVDSRFYSLEMNTLPQTEAILFYNSDNSLLTEKSVRQALTYALPDKFNQGKEAFSPLPQNSWAKSTMVKKYPQSVDLAKSLINKFASASAESKLKIQLSSHPALLPTAEEIAHSWEPLNIDTSIANEELPGDKYQVYLGLVDLPTDPDQYSMWHSTQSTNIGNYKSFKVDRLLEEGRRTLDFKTRDQIYSDFQKAITEDAPAAFLFYPTVYDIKRKY